jgi:hypothetical protein
VCGLEELLALDERQPRNVAAVKMQKIESVVDEPCSAFAVRRRPGVSEARQSRFVNATEFEIGGLHVEIRERGSSARIFVGNRAGRGLSLRRSGEEPVVGLGAHDGRSVDRERRVAP